MSFTDQMILLKMQDKHNILKSSENIKLFSSCRETARTALCNPQFSLFLKLVLINVHDEFKENIEY